MADWSHQPKAEAEIVWHFRQGAKSVVLVLPTGGGKCFGKGTPILLHNGDVKAVEDVAVGDALMGPDSKPRIVASLARGMEAMYRVIPKKGMPYVVNESHVLSLKITPSKAGERTSIDSITVANYLKSTAWYRHRAKGWRVAVDYPQLATRIDPYFVGLWLGDGSRFNTVGRVGTVTIHKPEKEVEDACRTVAIQFGCTLTVSRDNGKCPSYTLARPNGSNCRNPVRVALESYGLGARKFIPRDYMVNDRDTRLAVLAGLLDSDGYMHHNGFDFISADRELAEGVATISQSLGFAAYMKPCKKGIASTGFVGDYFRVSISGNCDTIPTRITHKRAEPRTQAKDHLVHGITIESIGVGEYFGFELSGPDRLFLLSDFTVVHNTRTAGNMMWKAWTQKRHKSIFVADRRELVLQPARAFAALGYDVGVTMADAGEDADGQTWNRPDAPIQICSKQTLATGRYNLPDAHFVVTDECHTSITEVYAALMRYWPNAWEIGLTATPVRGDGKGLGRRYQAIVTGATYALLQKNGVLVPVACKAPKSAVQRASEGGMKPTGKTMVGDPVGWWKKWAEGRKTFAFCKNVAESRGLRDEFRRHGISAGHVDGTMKKADIDAEMNRFRSGETLVICNCNMLKYGVDVPDAACLLINAPFGSFVDFRQSGGRVMRAAPGKKDALIIDMAGAVNYHGFPDEDLEWSLDDERSIDAEHKKGMKDGKTPKPITCPTCFEIFKSRSTCPACGWEIPEKRGQTVANKAGTLTDVHRGDRGGCGLSAPRTMTPTDLKNAWHRALAIAANTGKTCRVAAGIFRSSTKGALEGQDFVEAGLSPLPERWQWNKSVAEVFPDFVRKKKEPVQC